MGTEKFKRNTKRRFLTRRARSNLDFIAPFSLEKCQEHLAGMREPSHTYLDELLPVFGWDVTVDFEELDPKTVHFEIHKTVLLIEHEESWIRGLKLVRVRFSGVLQAVGDNSTRIKGKLCWDSRVNLFLGAVLFSNLMVFLKPIIGIYMLNLLLLIIDPMVGLYFLAPVHFFAGILLASEMDGWSIALCIVLTGVLLARMAYRWRIERLALIEKIAYVLGEEFGRPLDQIAAYFNMDQMDSLEIAEIY